MNKGWQTGGGKNQQNKTFRNQNGGKLLTDFTIVSFSCPRKYPTKREKWEKRSSSQVEIRNRDLGSGMVQISDCRNAERLLF